MDLQPSSWRGAYIIHIPPPRATSTSSNELDSIWKIGWRNPFQLALGNVSCSLAVTSHCKGEKFFFASLTFLLSNSNLNGKRASLRREARIILTRRNYFLVDDFFSVGNETNFANWFCRTWEGLIRFMDTKFLFSAPKLAHSDISMSASWNFNLNLFASRTMHTRPV